MVQLLYTVKVINITQRSSPLVRGRLEIPVEVTISMKFLDCNELSLEALAYRKLVDVVYELSEQPVCGNFRDYTADVFRAIDNTDSSDSGTDQQLRL